MDDGVTGASRPRRARAPGSGWPASTPREFSPAWVCGPPDRLRARTCGVGVGEIAVQSCLPLFQPDMGLSREQPLPVGIGDRLIGVAFCQDGQYRFRLRGVEAKLHPVTHAGQRLRRRRERQSCKKKSYEKAAEDTLRTHVNLHSTTTQHIRPDFDNERRHTCVVTSTEFRNGNFAHKIPILLLQSDAPKVQNGMEHRWARPRRRATAR